MERRPIVNLSGLLGELPAGDTLPAQNTPAFSVHANTGTTLNNTWATKVTFDGVDLDTDGAFSNSRFQPQVPGWYSLTAKIYPLGVSANAVAIKLNGTAHVAGTQYVGSATVLTKHTLYLNGTTGYVEVYGFSASANTIQTGIYLSHFSGFKLSI